MDVSNIQSSFQIDEFNVPKSFRDDELKWNGWGYIESYFDLSQTGEIYMASKHYSDLDHKIIPQLRPWIEKNLGVDFVYQTSPMQLENIEIPVPVANISFVEFLKYNCIPFTNSSKCRINRCHGQALHDIYSLWTGAIGRLPDLVVWPKSGRDVELVIQGANQFDVVLIPIGGGTSVSSALECPSGECRCICSIDMSLMNRIIWIDDKNLLCRVEAGILGQNLEEQLNKLGYTCGHEPDSMEFSSVGGWISTRASGMKKNKYGNIEDLLIQADMITPSGKLCRYSAVPRISSGPDVQHIILGSEGTYGVITEATLKMFPFPELRRFGSIVFQNYEQGIQFLREVAVKRCQPASLRLVDNEQFIMGQAMKPQAESVWESLKSNFGKLYITRWKGFDINKMVAATCVFEGGISEVDHQSKILFELADKYGGINAGEEGGRYGYRLTFAIAYLRDLGLKYGVIGESFETSIPWSKVSDVCKNVKTLLVKEANKCGIKHVLATSRVTQVYDSGACVYFYFGFNCRGISDPLRIYENIEIAARDEIIRNGGSISHHHGIGKIRKRWIPNTITPSGIYLLQSIKEKLDPNNIMANNNLIDLVSKI